MPIIFVVFGMAIALYAKTVALPRREAFANQPEPDAALPQLALRFRVGVGGELVEAVGEDHVAAAAKVRPSARKL
jgi:hypothetical protein